MNRRSHRLASLALVVLGAIAVLRGCNCGADPVRPLPDWSCEDQGRRPSPDDDACPGGDRFVKGVCAPVRCDAGGGEGNCCPGTICTGGGACEVPASRLVECESDAACDAGKKCLDRPRIKADAKTCGFPPVAADGSCPEGVPFNGRCVEKAPCEAGCAAGRVCNIDLDRCEEPASDATGCDVTCDDDEMLVFADPDAMLFDQCCAVSCACLPLPDLLPGAWGRFSDLAVTSSEILVSGYDTTYGDLVLGRFDKASEELTELEYVDGVPASGNVVAHPDGPRGGLEDPGADVGQYTALALQGGAPRIAYYDVDNRDLRWAAESGGSWATSLVDDGRDGAGMNTGDVGRYTSALVDAAGIAHVVYYAHRVEVGGELVTTPMYARATNTSPDSYDDWQRVAIEPVGSCEDTCTEAQSCVLDGGTAQCRTTRTDCSATCACDAVCVDAGGTAQCRPSRPRALLEPCDGSCDAGRTCVSDGAGGTTCGLERAGACGGGCGAEQLCVDDGLGGAVCRDLKPYSTVAGLPKGVGLFASLTFDADVPTVVYYDAFLGQLRGAVAGFDRDDPIGTFTAMPVVCTAGDDVGQHARVATGPSGLYVAYQAGDGSTLMLYTGNDLMTGSSALVDDGTRDGGLLHLVGAFADIAFDATGAPYIAYADQTENDLVLAYQRSGAWTHTVILGDGAYGSFSRVAIDAGRAYLSTYERKNDAGPRDRSELVVETRDLSSLP